MCLANVGGSIQDDLAKMRHLSYSQLSTYLLCPMRYSNQYVWGTAPESKPAALIFGKSIHRAVERYYRHFKDTGEAIRLEELEHHFQETLTKEVEETEVEITFKDGEDIEALREQGLSLMRIFHAEIKPQKVMAVEFPFSVSLPDLDGVHTLPVKLVGVFDLIEADEDGTYVIGELKTSGQKFSSLRLEHDLQATCYSYAAKKLGLSRTKEDGLIRYDVLLKTKKPSLERYFVVRTEAEHQRLIHTLNHVNRAIEERIFFRQTGWQCGDCQFRKSCLGK